MPLHIETPLVESRPLGLITGKRIWLKMEALQVPGSFKIRGVGEACVHYANAGAERFISSSGGNAGLAVAYAGRRLRLPVTVVVPETTTELAKRLLRAEGADVIVYGASWQEANEKATSLVGKTEAFIHPFDDPLLWRGHATMIDEVAGQGIQPDAVVVAVGGGGLLCGVAEGMERNGWHDRSIIAVETVGAASLRRAMEAGEPVALERIATVATSLGAKQVCRRAFEWTNTRKVTSAIVTDEQALRACRSFLSDHRILVEPACGAALALAYGGNDALKPYKDIVFIVCGGATTDMEQIDRWLAACGSSD
ncbi:MAG: serine dehydratase [Treponema sp. GWB1_62_6]|nr:MAG: serine dehydratase [Treponema sp. GWB1_62_6]OHE62522.1 MAG: serine dehydratase [Treponema sp. GWA1_62_8]OHE67952.1 MAG: serine dehydratase [Treponema sp. RIFOXYC1_FULL_61_9]OHE68544.1 MAG: serine dehydratase [Treponema sp. GWC1_61_84]HCM27857.1 serine dehydratase [Treponema sp.]